MNKEISIDEILRGSADDDYLTGGADINVDDLLKEDYNLENNVVNKSSRLDFYPNLDISKSSTGYAHDKEIEEVLKQADLRYGSIEQDDYQYYAQDLLLNKMDNETYFKKKDEDDNNSPYKCCFF